MPQNDPLFPILAQTVKKSRKKTHVPSEPSSAGPRLGGLTNVEEPSRLLSGSSGGTPLSLWLLGDSAWGCGRERQPLDGFGALSRNDGVDVGSPLVGGPLLD